MDTTDTHTYTIDTTGTLGAVTNNNDGTFSYNANGAFEDLAAGETATDTFTYTVNDGHGGTDTATATITITGQNDAPVAADVTGSAAKTAPRSSISADFTDVDTSDTHTYHRRHDRHAGFGDQQQRRHLQLRRQRRLRRPGRRRNRDGHLHLHRQRRQWRHRHGDGDHHHHRANDAPVAADITGSAAENGARSSS